MVSVQFCLQLNRPKFEAPFDVNGATMMNSMKNKTELVSSFSCASLSFRFFEDLVIDDLKMCKVRKPTFQSCYLAAAFVPQLSRSNACRGP